MNHIRRLVNVSLATAMAAAAAPSAWAHFLWLEIRSDAARGAC